MSETHAINKHTKITTSIIGVLLGSAGIINHGIFEILQGNTPTNGFFIEAIGEAHRFWIYGTESAITFLPNFLITGIMTILIGSLIILWSIKYLHTKHGATVFLLLMILLTFVGGGIGHIIIYLPTWAYATRIHSSLNWWKKILPNQIRKMLASMWQYGVILFILSWLIVMELGIFGYIPGLIDPDTILSVVFLFLLFSVIMVNITFISAFAIDIQSKKYT